MGCRSLRSVLAVQQIVKTLHGYFAAQLLDNGVALVGGQLYLILQIGDASDQLVLSSSQSPCCPEWIPAPDSWRYRGSADA